MKLLIIDDSMVVRRSIQRLTTNGKITHCDQARNGREAVELARAHGHEAATLDITMPEMDGLETIRELMTINPEMRVLVISALGDKATAIEMIKRGAMGFILKPFTGDQLFEAFDELTTD